MVSGGPVGAPFADDPSTDGPVVAILADDLIWATRLDRLVRDAGGRPLLLRSTAALERSLQHPGPALAGRPNGVVVDLTSRAYDGIDAVRRAASAGVPVVAVGQHDDREAREAARTAGAAEVFAYGRLFSAGPRVLGGWVAVLPSGSAGPVEPSAAPAAATHPGAEART